MPVGFHFDPRQIGRLAHDLENADRGLLPRLRTDMRQVGREARNEARRRIIEYAGDTKRVRTSVLGSGSSGGIQSASDIYDDGSGVYASVGQTWYRSTRFGNPNWSDIQYWQGLNPVADQTEPKALKAMEDGTTKVLATCKLL